ncbi:MAG: TAXI family TRAP transporter solute-binding subunit [Alphaproteobacteria bacterium]|nr:TAXI family TRAP transporter solute-binding subunit [Alphaproteobacteria bacterium]
MNLKTSFLAAVGVAALGLAAGPAGAQTLYKMNGGLTGTYPLYAAKFAEIVNKNVPGVQVSAVSGDSVQAQIDMQKGDIQFKIGYTYDIRRIADGLSTVPIKTPDVCHLMTLYGSGLFILAKADSPINSLADLPKGRYRIWTGPRTGFFYNLIEPVMEAAGVKISDIERSGSVLETFSYTDTVQAWQDRRLDLTFMSGGIPYNLMMQIDQQPGFKLIKMGDAALKKLSEIRPGIGQKIMAKGTYRGQTDDVAGPWYVNQVIGTTKVSEDHQYRITKAINENAKQWHGLFGGSEEIGVNDPLAFNAVPLCKGAERYYKEIGKLS